MARLQAAVRENEPALIPDRTRETEEIEPNVFVHSLKQSKSDVNCSFKCIIFDSNGPE